MGLVYSYIKKKGIKDKDGYYACAGICAICEVINRFDPEKGRFTTFATPRIIGAIKDEQRKNGSWSSLRASDRKLLSQIEKAQEVLEYKYQKEPTAEKLAELLKCDREKIITVMRAAGKPVYYDGRKKLRHIRLRKEGAICTVSCLEMEKSLFVERLCWLLFLKL